MTLFFKMYKDISEGLRIVALWFVSASLHSVFYPYIVDLMFARTKIYDIAIGLYNLLYISFATAYHNVIKMTAWPMSCAIH